MNRKQFLQNALKAAGALALTNVVPTHIFAADGTKQKQLTILHTNDVHSRLDPFPMDGGKYQGLGGIAARAQLLEQIRATGANTLLLDAGDMFQGTPYFNMYKGEAEILAMNKLGYDCGTLGNHDFDGGLDNLMVQLAKAQFPIVCCNYDFSSTVLADKIAPYTVVRKRGVKVGIIGVGIALEGLVPDSLYGATVYQEPVSIVNTIAARLKRVQRCNLVVCLSHLGYSYDGNKLSDKKLAAETYDVDLIIGGHTHTFLDEPTTVQNKRGKQVLINQVGFGGIKLGRLDFDFFQEKNTKNTLSAHSGIFIKETSV